MSCKSPSSSPSIHPQDLLASPAQQQQQQQALTLVDDLQQGIRVNGLIGENSVVLNSETSARHDWLHNLKARLHLSFKYSRS